VCLKSARVPSCPSGQQYGAFQPRVGILLVNLGTPTAPTAAALRPYLKQFLSDQRVIEVPRLLWWFILNLFILTTRPAKSAHAYAQIWNTQRNASPLKVITEAQTAALRKRFDESYTIEYAMRYGAPSIPDTLSRMKAEGCTRILICPLYPQYSAATVATVMDEASRWMLNQRWQPALRTLPPYYDHPAYIGALAQSVTSNPKAMKAQALLATLHGMPKAYCEQGDPYYCHSHKTVRLLAEKLGTTFCRTPEELAEAVKARKPGTPPPVLLTFQSRFGKAEWLQPYTAEVLTQLPGFGITNIATICPGFAADCVETLEEIALTGKASFLQSGGQSFTFVPCLNDSPAGIDMLEGLIQNELWGWDTLS
jgi:ferrochelatase